MGLIREPKNVDFYVIDKPWTEKERGEFSELIRQKKEQFKKPRLKKDDLKITKRKNFSD